MVCFRVCKNYKAKKQPDESHYELGHKRCSTCEIFINWDGNNCPCCTMLRRTNPKGTREGTKLYRHIRRKDSRILLIFSENCML